MHLCRCVEVRGQFQLSPPALVLFEPRPCHLQLDGLATEPPRSACVCPTHARDSGTHDTATCSFYTGAGEPNTCLNACTIRNVVSKPLSQSLSQAFLLCLPDADYKGGGVSHHDCGLKENYTRPINEKKPASHPWTKDARIVSDVSQIPVRSSSVYNVCRLLTVMVDGCFLRTEMPDSRPPCLSLTSFCAHGRASAMSRRL